MSRSPPIDPGRAWRRHAAQRGTTPDRLRRRLQGDLDTIVAKALKKTPGERYASVAALADDVRRSLHHEPISARPDTLRYRTAHVRAAPWLGRVAAAAAVVAAGRRPDGVLHEASRDRARRAQLEAQKAARVSELMIGLLSGADPYATPGTPRRTDGARAARQGRRAVQKELAGQPELQAEMLTVMGRTYRRLGLSRQGTVTARAALAVGRPVFGQEHERLAQSLHDLGVLFMDRGNDAAADSTSKKRCACGAGCWATSTPMWR